MLRTTILTITACHFLTACVSAHQRDPQIVSLVSQIRDQATDYFSSLAAKPAGECDWEHNKIKYAELELSAEKLETHLKTNHSGKLLIHAADALSAAIADAARSHQLASATTDDVHGPCLAPSALILNADAIARASTALAATQQAEGSSQ